MKNIGIGNVTCPHCGHIQAMDIPSGACVPMYRCEQCRQLVQAKKECCVFCEYGDRPCPVGHPKA